MSNGPTAPSVNELAEAVRKFDALYGDMERVLWHLSTNCRTPLLQGDGGSPVLETLVRTLRSWWRVRGATADTDAAMVQALVTLEWSPELFEPLDAPPAEGETEAIPCVSG